MKTQRLSEVAHKLWQTVNRNNPGYLADHACTPLLDNHEITDLRKRALGMVEYPMKNKPVLHRQHGEHVSPLRGYGLDYEESRVYQPGDEVRFMNWRLAARAGEPYIKVFREERRPSTFVMLDRRSSMQFGTRVRLKVTQALRAAILLMFFNQYCGRSVSGMDIENKLCWLSAAADEQSLLGVISKLNRACTPRPGIHKHADFEEIVRAMQSTLVPGTRVYLISDFIDASCECHGLLARLAAEHQVSAVHIVDPAEQQLPKAGKLRLVDAAGSQARSVDTSNPLIAERYEQAARQHLESRESLLRGLGIGYVRLSTTVDNIESELAFT